MIDDGLTEPGARETTRRRDRVVAEFAGCTYLLPTIVLCESPEHRWRIASSCSRSRRRRVPAVGDVRRIGPTLVVTALTNDERFRRGCSPRRMSAA